MPPITLQVTKPILAVVILLYLVGILLLLITLIVVDRLIQLPIPRLIPVGTATAPSMSSYSQDLCIVGVSGGVQVTGFGVSGGTYVTDENCERMKLSKLLYDFNMRVASIAILCQDDRVFSAMEHAGTPCPFEGKIGEDATKQWEKYDVERPDYDQYIQKLKRRHAIDNKTEFVPVDSEYDLYGDDD